MGAVEIDQKKITLGNGNRLVLKAVKRLAGRHVDEFKKSMLVLVGIVIPGFGDHYGNFLGQLPVAQNFHKSS